MKTRTYTEEDRKNFAYGVFRGMSDEKLRRLSSAYDWASVEKDAMGSVPAGKWDKTLVRYGLEGFAINGRRITYRQAHLAYRIVNGEFGGLKGLNGPVLIFENNPLDSPDLRDYPKPEPIPRNTPITFVQSAEEYMQEADREAGEHC